ncbi:hypothetical protein DFH11DRAFT_1549595 [Phellopilus nigrolimitatus]|nr:hypothetical protein DFH11DRAFT_1549595 [Phellopilus nigrolimitatus]
MASTEPRTPPLPFEITENIIQLYLGGPYTFPDSHRRSDLAPLLLVCKGWQEYGERQLYRSIYISESCEDSADVAALLRATLSQNSRLAGLVCFFTFESKCLWDESVRTITQIISLSSNLTHLSISRLGEDWQTLDTTLVESLRHALAERSLKHFRLYSENCHNWIRKIDMLCSPEKTLALLENWPDLEEFSLVNGIALEYPFDFPPETPVRCLALRRVKVQGLNIACIFAKMAPSVEEVDIATHNGSVDIACLHTWSETLIRLNLDILKKQIHDIRYFPPLRNLRYLICSGTDVHPRFLETMNSLEELIYYVHPQQVEQLVNLFKAGTGSGDFLPELKFLDVLSPVSFLDPELIDAFPAALESLEEICSRRRISFTIENTGGFRN